MIVRIAVKYYRWLLVGSCCAPEAPAAVLAAADAAAAVRSINFPKSSNSRAHKAKNIILN